MSSVGKHEVDGTIVFVANDVCCPVAECELGNLIVSGGELVFAALNGWGDGVFCELVALDYPPRVEVEELEAARALPVG